MYRRRPLNWGPRPINPGRLRHVSRDPEVINRKVYWCFEHRYSRQTVVNLCKANPFTRLFGSLFDPETYHGYALGHEFSLPGPFTGFIPIDDFMSSIMQNLDNQNTDRLSYFVRSHFTRDLWLHRDITGSPMQPWLTFNEPREAPTSLNAVNGLSLSVENGGDIRVKTDYTMVNGARVLRWNLRCHNGVIHLVDRSLITLDEE
ncbi:heme detoxification protein (fasciclin I) [Babesia bovis T2Bo]|uniref:FAS1 domain-containing protein n=1 Tax=Babesia bovis TaxID=5865 RepID=A7APP5_BABBO|nr:heme detoxification protein (fasciclin I) [Babesia bovis T2Bo]EDO08529.1 heme detoxification protein (fasciclin I) [Babesia bovis T2Bo]|eukprot:XP_001612097.1 hypothetical protein [Babesia bovis T2Bo]